MSCRLAKLCGNTSSMTCPQLRVSRVADILETHQVPWAFCRLKRSQDRIETCNGPTQISRNGRLARVGLGLVQLIRFPLVYAVVLLGSLYWTDIPDITSEAYARNKYCSSQSGVSSVYQTRCPNGCTPSVTEHTTHLSSLNCVILGKI